MKKLYRNPGFYKELEELIGKMVIIRINYPSENFYFFIKGKLSFTTISKKSFTVIVEPKNKNYHAYINFYEKNVHFIKNNVIDITLLINEFTKDLVSYKLYDFYNFDTQQILKAINTVVEIKFPAKDVSNTIMGKLKYNKKENFYYIQDYDNFMFIKFVREMVLYVRKLDNNLVNYEFTVSSIDINTIRSS